MPLFNDEQQPRRPVPTPEQQRLRQERGNYQRRQQQYAPPEQPVAPRPIPQQPPATRPSQGWTDEQTGYVQQGIQQSAPQPEAPEGWVLHPITGQLVKDPLYVPKAAEVVEEVKEAVTPKVSWLKWLPWILLGFLFLGGSIGGVAWSLWPDRDHDDRDDYRPARVENTADQYLTTFVGGNYELWKNTLERFDNNEFRDWKEMNDAIQPDLNDILDRAEGPAIEAHKSINGKLWVAQTPEQDREVEENRREARKVLKSFVDGYGKWAR